MSKERSPEPFLLSFWKANGLGLLLLVPISLICLGGYLLVWGRGKALADLVSVLDHPWILFPLLIAGIVLHELIHAVAWVKAGNKPWDTIRFGINLPALAPYAHCSDPVDIRVYRISIAAPLVVLGLFPYLAGLLSGSGWLAGFGYILTVAAAGDILMLWLLRDVKPGTMVRDHPDKVGCEIVETE